MAQPGRAINSHVYVLCPANATTVCGNVGQKGINLKRLIIFPLAASPDQISVQDGALASVPVLASSAALVDLKPIGLNFGDGMRSKDGTWSVIVGANATAIAVGDFLGA